MKTLASLTAEVHSRNVSSFEDYRSLVPELSASVDLLDDRAIRLLAIDGVNEQIFHCAGMLQTAIGPDVAIAEGRLEAAHRQLAKLQRWDVSRWPVGPR